LEDLKRKHDQLIQEIVELKQKYFEIEKRKLASRARSIVNEKASNSMHTITQGANRLMKNINEIQKIMNNLPRFDVSKFPTNENLEDVNIDELILEVKSLRKKVKNKRYDYDVLMPAIDTDVRIVTDALSFFQTEEGKIPIKFSETFESNELNNWFKEKLMQRYNEVVKEARKNNDIMRNFLGYVNLTVHDKYYNKICEYENYIDRSISYLRNLQLLQIIQKETKEAEKLHISHMNFVTIEEIHNVFIKLDSKWNRTWFLGKDYYGAFNLIENYRDVISVIERYILPFSFDPQIRLEMQIYLDSKLDELQKREAEILAHPPEYWVNKRLKEAKKIAGKNQKQKEELEKAETYYLLSGLLDIPDYFLMAANQTLNGILD
jgi:hypothetical protein